MIKSDKGNIEINGTAAQALKELSHLVHALYFDILIERCDASPEEAKADILAAVEQGFKSKEELKAEAKEAVGVVIGDLGNLLGSVLGDALKDILSRKDDK